jgi:hypothetical protein
MFIIITGCYYNDRLHRGERDASRFQAIPIKENNAGIKKERDAL